MTVFRSIALAAMALSLSACVSLFPKAKPAQMYRLTPVVVAAGAPAGPGKAFEVLKGRIGFDQASSSDRILTVNGSETAYIAASRWVARAPVMVSNALDQAFAANAAAPRLVELSRVSKASAVLRVDVERFEAVYENGAEAAPTVVVRMRAIMTRSRDRLLLGERVFEARQPAADNRVSAIVPAFDAATTKVLGDMGSWSGGFAGDAAG